MIINEIVKNLAEMFFIELSIYEDPKYFAEPVRSKIDTSKIRIRDIKKYRLLFFNISQAIKKVQKYPIIFEYFYPESEKITNYEALEHHVHAYLEDLDSLKEKIRIFLTTLKNDLKKIASNKKEVDSAIKFVVGKVISTFAQVSEHRDPHHHEGPKFIDSDLVDAKAADTIKSMSNIFNPEFIQSVQKKGQDSFAKSKSFWIETAKKNSVQIDGLVEHVLSRHREWMYQFLNIKPIVEELLKTPK